MYLTRHQEMLEGISLDQPIIIIGVGSIGSYACLSLAKLGYNNILVVDDGVIEEENIAPQLYRMSDVGKPKVTALAEIVEEFTGTDILTYNGRVDNNGMLKFDVYYDKQPNSMLPVLILAVDSMHARKFITNEYQGRIKILIDARMSIEFLTIITAPNHQYGRTLYADTLFSDEEGVQEACTNKAISYTSSIAGGLVAKAVLMAHKEKFEVPFSTLNFCIKNSDIVRLV